MKIIVDAMGGDKAPQEIVKGALLAHEKFGTEIVLVGQKEAIEPLLTGSYRPEIVDAREIVMSSCLQSFPASRSFQMSQLFASSGQSIGVSASTSVLPMDIQ